MRHVLAACLLLASLGCRTALPEAPPHAFVPSALAGPAPVQVCWVEYARSENPGWYGTAGHSTLDAWHTTASGLLIRHPQGDYLLDVGNSRTLFDDVQGYDPFTWIYVKAAAGGLPSTKPLAEVLAGVGEDPAKLKGIVLSHAHLDHAGNLRDLPGVPVLVDPAELEFAQKLSQGQEFDLPPSQAALLVSRAKVIHFEPRPYANFDESLDLFGDGSVVLVPMRGHTPGSVGTFVNLGPHKRLFHVGDVVNVREGYERRAGKAFVLAPTDHDRKQAEAMVSRLAQLHAADPELLILPAHDREAWSAAFGAEPGCITP